MSLKFARKNGFKSSRFAFGDEEHGGGPTRFTFGLWQELAPYTPYMLMLGRSAQTARGATVSTAVRSLPRVGHDGGAYIHGRRRDLEGP